MMKVGEVELGHVPWILNDDDVSSGEGFIVEQVLEVLCLEIEFLNGFIAEHISSCLDDSNVSGIIEHLINTYSSKLCSYWSRLCKP